MFDRTGALGFAAITTPGGEDSDTVLGTEHLGPSSSLCNRVQVCAETPAADLLLPSCRHYTRLTPPPLEPLLAACDVWEIMTKTGGLPQSQRRL